MIERYTIKFGPAVSQKELEKALNEDAPLDYFKKANKHKVRIELIGDIEDIHKLQQTLKELSKS